MASKYKGIYSVNDMYRLYPVTLPSIAVGGVITDFALDGILYRMHKFDVGASSLDISFISGGSNLLVDMLIIAGGGSGGQGNSTNANGGGGAGGVLYATGHALTLGSYSIMVGAGGAALGDNAISAGNVGENSYVDSFIAIGGGGGAGGTSVWTTESGGSSGGDSINAVPSGSVTLQTDVGGVTGYGNLGGQSAVNYVGAGGGGAGSVGEAGATTFPGGNGGQGLVLSIEGVEKGYAGGGGGGNNSSERAGTGFHGGGRGVGNTSEYSNTSFPSEINPVTLGSGTPDGVPNTGGGGGGGTYWNSVWPTSGAGGSGVVIIRYPIGVA